MNVFRMDVVDYSWKLVCRRIFLDDIFFEDGNIALNNHQTQFITHNSDYDSDDSEERYVDMVKWNLVNFVFKK